MCFFLLSNFKTFSCAFHRPPERGGQLSSGLQGPGSVYPGPAIDPDREIRVLHLLPGQLDDEIECSLCVQSIDCGDEVTGEADPEYSPSRTYDALSYISIKEAGRLAVTKNLWKALRRLRSTDTIRRLWADQLCIDQANVHERNRQISHMGCIYGHATKLLIWLGDATTTATSNDPPATRRERLRQLEEAIAETTPSWCTRAWVVQDS